jgi:hypothetical protein
VAAVGGIFGGGMSIDENGEYIDFDVREFILDPAFGLPYMRQNYVNYIYNERLHGNNVTQGGDYHIVRFFSALYDEPIIEFTLNDVDEVVISLPILADIIQPIFTSVMLLNYDLAPTEEQALNALQDIFDALFSIEESNHIEWCGQSVATGEGEPGYCGCGEIHALSDCLNTIDVTHGSYTCGTCCWRSCPGHPWENETGGGVSICNTGCEQNCDGTTNCNRHRTLHVTLRIDGITELLYIYFHSPIDELRNLSVRTPEQEDRLMELEDMLELTMEFIMEFGFSFGGGMTMDELNHVDWVHGTRENMQVIVDNALSWVGQQGRQPFWSYMGFASRVPWCATFVYRIYHDAGFASIYPTHGADVNAASTISLVNYFKSAGQWQNNSFRNLAAGDVIFFDWTLNGQPNHVGIVVGRCGTNVYYVDGNSSDSVKLQFMLLDNPHILGYAILW